MKYEIGNVVIKNDKFYIVVAFNVYNSNQLKLQGFDNELLFNIPAEECKFCYHSINDYIKDVFNYEL